MKFSSILTGFALVGAGFAASQAKTNLRHARRFEDAGSHKDFDENSIRSSELGLRQFEDPKGLDQHGGSSSSATHAPTNLPIEHEPGTKPRETSPQAKQN